MVSLFGSISWHPPGANRDQSVSLLISGTSVAAVKKERKKKYMQIRLKGNYSRCGRQNFSGFLLLGLRHNPRREGFWASLTHVSSPDRHQTPSNTQLPLRSFSTQQHPLCKFYNHSAAVSDVCVRTLKRDISSYLAYEISWDQKEIKSRVLPERSLIILLLRSTLNLPGQFWRHRSDKNADGFLNNCRPEIKSRRTGGQA